MAGARSASPRDASLFRPAHFHIVKLKGRTRERGEPGPDSQRVIFFVLWTIVTHERSRTVRGHSPIHQEKHGNILTIIPINSEQG